MEYRAFSPSQLEQHKSALLARHRAFQSQSLNIDMTRGKPSPEQLDLSVDMLHCVNAKCFRSPSGVDCRNYGGLDGIPEAKELFSHYLEVEPQEVIIGGNSSLQMMYDALVRAMIHGVVGSEQPWGKLPKVKWLCPSPGYDRHFAICEHLGIEMITIGMGPDGPDMAQVESIAADDESVKGIWCVPKYSNPTGVVYSDTVVERLATMKTAAADFRVFWDNAYAVHHLNDRPAPLKNLLQACQSAGNSDRVFLFGSTSKISFAGGGVAMMAASQDNIEATKKQMSYQTIGPDKLNQLRHVLFFRDLDGIETHMHKHADILKPKFDAVQDVLEVELADRSIASWSRPRGGFFVSLDTLDGCAKAVVSLAATAGVKLTPAGATFPYGKDPRNRNIRLAPSLPSIQEIRQAMEVVAVCIQLASIDRLLAST
jgi:aspartate/methionine/tyrosine aminotransferase